MIYQNANNVTMNLMSDEQIKGIFSYYGQFASGKDLPMLRAIEIMLKENAYPQRTWVGLPMDEFKFIASKYLLSSEVGLEYFQEEIEAKLKEKNT